MNKYDYYKPFTGEISTEIPNHWSQIKLKYILNRRSEKNDPIVTEEILSLSMEKGVTLLKDKPTGGNKPKDDLTKYNIVHVNDIVLNSMNIIVGSVGLSKYYGLVSPVYYILYPQSNDSNVYFLNYIFSSQVFQKNLIGDGNGILIKESESGKLNTIRMRVPYEKLGTKILPIPPLHEQHQIVQFLDSKTELIDRLISTKERKITLLKEQRTSLINQVVTKGLNPNVKMKDSGVEWIGEIPEGWCVGKLKHICRENLKSLSNNTNPDYELDYVEISDVDSDGIIKNSTHYTFSESPSRCRRIVSKGDIILSTVRTYLRSIGLIENEVSDLICSTGFSVLTPNYGVYSKHLFYMVRTEWFISMVISKSEGVSYPSIQSEKLMNNLILVVPIDEQHQIVEFLDEKTKEIDDMVQLERRKIDLLKEYRQSLISEVVTGKIKVTN